MYKAVIIGCGGRGKAHARGYAATTEAELLACADPFEAGRSTFQEEFGVPRAYQDYREMLEKEEPDIVSVCTWIGLHREMVEAAVQHASVRAIHCEKPMAPTWADAKALYQACVDNDITITFCHQRRFGACWIKAKALLKASEIGELVRLEGACSNLLDWGTHWFDMFFFFNDQEPVEWVMGQIDVEGTYDIFGVPVEGSGLSWMYPGTVTWLVEMCSHSGSPEIFAFREPMHSESRLCFCTFAVKLDEHGIVDFASKGIFDRKGRHYVRLSLIEFYGPCAAKSCRALTASRPPMNQHGTNLVAESIAAQVQTSPAPTASFISWDAFFSFA